MLVRGKKMVDDDNFDLHISENALDFLKRQVGSKIVEQILCASLGARLFGGAIRDKILKTTPSNYNFYVRSEEEFEELCEYIKTKCGHVRESDFVHPYLKPHKRFKVDLFAVEWRRDTCIYVDVTWFDPVLNCDFDVNSLAHDAEGICSVQSRQLCPISNILKSVQAIQDKHATLCYEFDQKIDEQKHLLQERALRFLLQGWEVSTQSETFSYVLAVDQKCFKCQEIVPGRAIDMIQTKEELICVACFDLFANF
jgi:hypothetical protein